MHKQQIFNHQVEFCRMDAVLVIMEVMAEQGTYLLHTRLGSVSVPLPHSCIECMANDTDGRGNKAEPTVSIKVADAAKISVRTNILRVQHNGSRIIITYIRV